MFEHLIPWKAIEGFKAELERFGIQKVSPYSKGTTSIVFKGELENREVLIKLQRPDSPRSNLLREADIVKVLEPYDVTPPLITSGSFKGLEYIVRGFAEGEPVMYAEVKKGHILEIIQKTALLDRLGLDHGQIQGGKHIIIGDRVWLIDFEKAGWRKPKNLTSALAMLFIGNNATSRRIREKFGVDERFLGELLKETAEYKRKGRLSGLLRLISGL
ncbi:serine/threonine protein kinase [Thermococcus sp. Bubb.Bath]|uniref:serine/threonine protein kinase n=1 Tax=Thermococcus sp. Bubb.Bath TaxID=1638242 RepID=UPI00143C618C|nr:serine/threonine protein kinase [Thermococcus sp. Bubb.Bath]NJF25078.1 serine/threonine protein kinase [Thermococcus sp. Bubb.Bath]